MSNSFPEICCQPGTVGMLFMYIFLTNMSGDDAGEVENMQDTLLMIENNHRLFWLIMLYIFSVCTYNCWHRDGSHTFFEHEMSSLIYFVN